MIHVGKFHLTLACIAAADSFPIVYVREVILHLVKLFIEFGQHVGNLHQESP